MSSIEHHMATLHLRSRPDGLISTIYHSAQSRQVELFSVGTFVITLLQTFVIRLDLGFQSEVFSRQDLSKSSVFKVMTYAQLQPVFWLDLCLYLPIISIGSFPTSSYEFDKQHQQILLMQQRHISLDNNSKGAFTQRILYTADYARRNILCLNAMKLANEACLETLSKAFTILSETRVFR